MNTGLALSAGQDGVFQHVFPTHDPHLAVVDLDAVDERAQIGLAEGDLAGGEPLASLQKDAGVEMVYVPYRDVNAAVVDLGEGRIDAGSMGLATLLPQLQAAKVRVLAVLNRVRSPAAPHVPTVAEAGFRELTFEGVTGFYGWRGMPGELRDRIAADVRAVADSPAIKERLEKTGIVARGSTPSEFAAAIEEQRAKVAAIAAAIGMKLAH